MSGKPSSWTETCVPKVTRPTCAYSGRVLNAPASARRACPSSSSPRQVSRTKTYAGGWTGPGGGVWYSIDVHVGNSSAGRLDSDAPA